VGLRVDSSLQQGVGPFFCFFAGCFEIRICAATVKLHVYS
jgi:hypothetical protein